jgi:methionyl-tRNA formyltransferase
VHNLIRGCDPQPGAHTTWRGTRLRLFEPRRDERGGPPGQVLAVDAQGLVVATGTGSVRCMRARGDGPKAAAAEVASTLGITPGALLGSAGAQ